MPGFEIAYISNTKRGRGDEEPQFLGRNGGGIQTGVEAFVYVQASGYKKITITPVSTRGPAQCYMEIPLSQVQEFVNALLAIAEEAEATA